MILSTRYRDLAARMVDVVSKPEKNKNYHFRDGQRRLTPGKAGSVVLAHVDVVYYQKPRLIKVCQNKSAMR